MGSQHSELIARAAQWLRSTRKCCLVVTEKSAWKVHERPDAMGWTADGSSIVVECKVSRSDFLADKRKLHHQLERLMGRERWYFAPPGLITPADIAPGVGLLQLDPGGRMRRVVEAVSREPSVRDEMAFLVHCARHAIAGDDMRMRGIVADAGVEADSA